ncbi:MAG: hypothetical protein JNL38_06310 [Myxococcales bacterium]|nr:hypothetical protein [Myxococcales bacterium]
MKLRLAILVSLGVASASLCTSSSARADDVPPPPTDCPPGSVGRTGHEGEACVATTCATDGECTGGKRCLEQALCVKVQTGVAGQFGRPFSRSVASRVCEPGKTQCLDGATCERAKRCVDPAKRADGPSTAAAPTTGPSSSTAAPPGPPPSKSRCGAAPGPASGTLPATLVAAALASLVRRRRR